MDHKSVIELLDYSHESGTFTWKKKRRGVPVGKALGCSNERGYLRITVLGKSCYVHRLAWFYVHGSWPTGQIDHIDGNKNNNAISNLRDVSPQGNAQNITKPRKNNNSSALGVSWHKKSSKWQVHICVYKHRKYIGLFENFEDAKAAYAEEKRKVVIK